VQIIRLVTQTHWVYLHATITHVFKDVSLRCLTNPLNRCTGQTVAYQSDTQWSQQLWLLVCGSLCQLLRLSKLRVLVSLMPYHMLFTCWSVHHPTAFGVGFTGLLCSTVISN